MGKVKEYAQELDNKARHLPSFSWGDTRGLRETLLSIYKDLSFQGLPLEKYGYPPYDGDHDLIALTKGLIKSLTGIDYKYLIITPGCTSAVNIAIAAMKKPYTQYVATRNLYYPRYPSMIEHVNELKHLKGIEKAEPFDIILVDSPSNPLGEVGINNVTLSNDVIWDGAYHSPVYGIPFGVNSVPKAKAFCGSFSKFTGINGIRLGWLATDNIVIYNSAHEYAKGDFCGTSYPSQEIVKRILSDGDRLNTYYIKSKAMIDNNKCEILKLKNIFGQDDIPNFGMFAFFKTDDKMEKLFEKAGIEFTNGKDCGAMYQSVRINLGNSNEDTKEMVKRIINADKV